MVLLALLPMMTSSEVSLALPNLQASGKISPMLPPLLLLLLYSPTSSITTGDGVVGRSIGLGFATAIKRLGAGAIG